MARIIEISDDLAEHLDALRTENQSYAEVVEELVNVYETEGTFSIEGYSE